MVTEFGGFARPQGTNSQPLSTAAERDTRKVACGPGIFTHLESKGIGWTVWCFEPDWGPTLIKNWIF
jgi:hypothetical protein